MVLRHHTHTFFFEGGGGGGGRGGAFGVDPPAACFGLGGRGGGRGGGAVFLAAPVSAEGPTALSRPALRSITSASALVGACAQARCQTPILDMPCPLQPRSLYLSIVWKILSGMPIEASAGHALDRRVLLAPWTGCTWPGAARCARPSPLGGPPGRCRPWGWPQPARGVRPRQAAVCPSKDADVGTSTALSSPAAALLPS